MKKTLFFLAAATFAAVGMAQAPTFEVTTQNGAVLLMSVVDGAATVTGGKLTSGTECNLGDLVIPATVEHDGNTVPVTTIGAAAFNHDTMTSVVIPSSVTSIKMSAFRQVEGLQSVTIPNSVTELGRMAFLQCASLTSVTLSEALTEIPMNAFYQCNLSSVTIPNSVTTISDFAFDANGNITNITIGSGVDSIGEQAFFDNSNLDMVTVLCTEVPRTGARAFTGSENTLTSVVVPCGTADAYRANEEWGKFVRIRENCGGDNPGEEPGEEPGGNEGIATTDMSAFNAYAAEGRIVVDCPVATNVQVFATDGRSVATLTANGKKAIEVPAAGVYIVSFDGRKATKTVVVK